MAEELRLSKLVTSEDRNVDFSSFYLFYKKSLSKVLAFLDTKNHGESLLVMHVSTDL